LAYETARVCDHENNNLRVLELGPPLEKDEEKRRKQLSRTLKRMNGMLTPMSKYYCSEMGIRTADTTIQVLGGSGYMKDYAAERYLRDARITTIYEGTSQLQVVAAVRGVPPAAGQLGRPHERSLRRPDVGRFESQLVAGGGGQKGAVRQVEGSSSRPFRAAVGGFGHFRHHRYPAPPRQRTSKELPAIVRVCTHPDELRLHPADMSPMEAYASFRGTGAIGGLMAVTPQS
jgi:hypothetical protein